MIAGAKPAVDADKAADVPLSKEEALEMRGHLRFLKEHRKVLALKVNAAEDLLLNGVREPTHRGVCQHLLDKVERSRVEAVAQRLEPAARVRLLEGVLGFAPDVAYVLLYLESLRDAAREEATPALSAALKRIDFAAISAAQMRRVLDLIVELYDARDRPQLMFSLLQSATFRAAFDDSAAALPAPLAEVVLPLRAVHAVVLRGKKNPFDAASLARGVAMLLQGRAKVLRAQSASTRSRLFDAGIDLCTERECAPGLLGLVDGFEPGERSTSEAMLRLAGWLLARGLEPDAKKLLARLSKEHPGFKLPQRWLTALEGPRIGGAGLAAAPGRGRDFWQEGMLLARQLPVWVSVGKPDAAPRFANAAALAESIAVPGVAACSRAAPRETARRTGSPLDSDAAETSCWANRSWRRVTYPPCARKLCASCPRWRTPGSASPTRAFGASRWIRAGASGSGICSTRSARRRRTPAPLTWSWLDNSVATPTTA